MGTSFTLFDRAKGLFAASPQKQAAQHLYLVIMGEARRPALYVEGGVPDTIDGRFDLLALYLYLMLRRLKVEGTPGRELGQQLFDVAFASFDETLREMGVGDLSVGKKVRKMAEAFYGRVDAYEKALAGGDEAFDEALVRNIYRGAAPSPAQLLVLKRAAEGFRSALESAPAAALLGGSWNCAAAA